MVIYNLARVVKQENSTWERCFDELADEELALIDLKAKEMNYKFEEHWSSGTAIL